jgi:stringent starvation protein B
VTETSTKPYLIRAIHEWCVDNGYTPQISVVVNSKTQVPKDYVRDGEIVLNISPMATNKLELNNDLIQFEARFSGVVHELRVPVSQVQAIFARENVQGMGFDVLRVPEVEEAEPEPMALVKPSLVVASVESEPQMQETEASVAENKQTEEKEAEKPPVVRKNHLVRVK